MAESGRSRITRVEVDKQSCLSSERCAGRAPGAFRMDDDFLAEATPQALELPEAELEAIARACPGLAIALHRAGDASDPGPG